MEGTCVGASVWLGSKDFFFEKGGNKKKLVARSIHTVEIGVGIAALIIFLHGARCFVHLAASVPTGGGNVSCLFARKTNQDCIFATWGDIKRGQNRGGDL